MSIEGLDPRRTKDAQMKTQERLVADAKTIVTVQAVRAANGKMMTAARGVALSPAASTPKGTFTLKAVADGGQRAMQALRKP